MSFGSSSQNPYQAPTHGYSPRPVGAPYRRKPSIAVGVASIAIGVLALLGVCGAFGGAFIIFAENNGQEPSPDSPALIGIGLAVLTGLGLSLVGSVVGLVGVIVPNQNKIFAVIGLLLNGLLFLGTVGIMVLGTVAG